DAALGEACDDGNTVDGDGCSASCGLPSCGDGRVDSGEVCDNGRDCTDGTPCTSATTCAGIGDGTCAPRAGDGCSATCMSDETCGNGVVDVGEQCDDHNTTAGDGCAATCKL